MGLEDWRLGKVTRLEWPCFDLPTPLDAQFSIHEREYGGCAERQCHLPQRISNVGFDPPYHLRRLWVHLVTRSFHAGRPANSRWLHLPLSHRDLVPSVQIDRDNGFGTLDQDRPPLCGYEL